MKSVRILLIFSLCASVASAGVDRSRWEPIGSGQDNATYKNKIDSDQLLTVVETETPEAFPLMNKTSFEDFIAELKKRRKHINIQLGFLNWKIKSYKLENSTRGQKVLIEGSFEKQGQEKLFFETHYYEGTDFRNYQIVFLKTSETFNSEKAFKILDEVASSRKPAASSDTQAAEISDDLSVNCSQRKANFLTTEAPGTAGAQTWNLQALREAISKNDSCAKEMIPLAIEESYEYWTAYGRVHTCLTEENSFQRGQECTNEHLVLLEKNLDFIDLIEEGVGLAAALDTSIAQEGTCASGDCDVRGTRQAQPLSTQQLDNLSDISAAVQESARPDQQCADKAKDKAIPQQGWDCAKNIVLSAWADLSSPIKALWSWGKSSIENRTLVSGLIDIGRSVRDPVDLGSKFIENLVAHFSSHYDGWDCKSWPERIQMICKSGGQVVAFIAAGKGLGAGARVGMRASGRAVSKVVGKKASAPVVSGVAGDISAIEAVTAEAIREASKLTGRGVSESSSFWRKVLKINQRPSTQRVNYLERYRKQDNAQEIFSTDRAHRTQAMEKLQGSREEIRKVSRFRRTRDQNRELKAQEILLSHLKRDQREMERAFRRAQRMNQKGSKLLPAVALPAGSASEKKQNSGVSDSPSPSGPVKLPEKFDSMLPAGN